MSKYFCYHKHTEDSLLDSCTNFKDYVDYEVSLGHTATAFTEHGKPLEWVKKKMYCDSKGIKYVHGVECYLTQTLSEKVRDNYHTILLAKNYAGIKEINSLISTSTDDEHTYYVNRLSFDEFLKISDNVIKISACLASPLNKLDISHPMYEKLVQHYDYLEIQYHNCQEQKDFNIHLAALAQKYHKPLIAATDTHSLNKYKAECRYILLTYKDKSYGNEDDLDLTYKTYDELVTAFETQDCLPKSVYMEAIENTNRLADSIEDFELDKSLKYPILYGTREADNLKFTERVWRDLDDKIANGIIPQEQYETFKTNITEELRVFKKIQMEGFMLSMAELITWCKENNIPVGTGRGSVCGSCIAYVTNITDVNPVKWNTVFSRFANEDRVEVGDIDVDVIADDRPHIFEHIISRFGTAKTARVPSFGTLQDKNTIAGICNALDKIWCKDHPDETKDSPYSLPVVKNIKALYEENPEKAKQQYKDIFYYFDGLIGTKISQSVHPAGMVISPIALADSYGVFHKEDDMCLMIDMDEAHDVGLVKYDFLILKTLAVINDICKMVGIHYPKSHEIDWLDKDVWQELCDRPTTIFQLESPFAEQSVRKFKPHSIEDLCVLSASLRPSGASYRDSVFNRETHKNPTPEIDRLLESSYGFLCYQEQITAFLQQLCGLSGSEADTVRRGIAKKKMDILEASMPKILEGYCENSSKPREIAEEEVKEYLKVIEDASSYSFGYNHVVGYSMLGYYCAYYRHYYPIEYITAYLNNAANEDDIVAGTELVKEYNIKILPPRFGQSAANYTPVSENVIAKGTASVKYLNASVSDLLYNMSKQKTYTSFMQLLCDIQTMGINSRQMQVLINIDYFANFGNVRELTKILETFELFDGGSKTRIAQDKLDTLWCKGIVQKYANNIGKNGNTLKTYKIFDCNSILCKCEKAILGLGLNDIPLKTKMENQREYLGYVDITTGKEEDRRKLLIEKVYPQKSKNNGEIWGYAVYTKSVGSGKTARLTVRARLYNAEPIQQNDIVYAESVSKNSKGYWYLDMYSKIFS